MWGEPRDSWLTELVQFIAFVVLGIAIVIGLTAVAT